MERADVVVVGGGTVGAWTACLLAEEGRSVVLVEADTLGSGASSRAAGMVRAQGGTEAAIRLGMFSREFYADPARPLPPRLRVRRPGLPDAVLHRRRGLGRARPDRAPALARARRGVVGRRRGRPPRHRPRPGRHARGVVRRRRRLHRRSPQRAGLHRRSRRARRRGARAPVVHRAARRGRPGRGGGHQRRSAPRRCRRPHRRAGPGRGRRRRGWTRVGGRDEAPGGRHRAGARRRPTHPADGLRRDVGHLLAAGRGGRPALGHEQPRRAAGPGPRVRPRLLRADARTRRRAVPGDRGTRRTALVGRHHRLHARPPADHRPVAPRRASRSPARSSPAPADTG